MKPPRIFIDTMGKQSLDMLSDLGFAAHLFIQSVFWIFLGRWRYQPVRVGAILDEAVEVGIRAIPIVTILTATIGVMLAIQGIYSLSVFGAESQVVIGLAFSIVREFAPLITGILVAGRSGSALAARLGTMKINQEVDALSGMGIDPVRYLVAPSLVAMLIMVPALTIWGCVMGLLAAGAYIGATLDMSMEAYFADLRAILSVNDVLHGFSKSIIFAILITLIGVMNGARVRGGAGGVGKATTRSVVMAISAIVITDMIFVFMVTR